MRSIDLMGKKYRLPDWLGAHEVEFFGAFVNMEGVEFISVYSDFGRVMVERSQLVEVSPPSIGDPITLPLTLAGKDGEELRIYEGAGYDMAAHTNIKDRNGDLSNVVSLSREQCRDAARAFWLLGKQT